MFNWRKLFSCFRFTKMNPYNRKYDMSSEDDIYFSTSDSSLLNKFLVA